ncbi:hypothetical protein BGLA2_1470012 [Burkholderia gladioli]|nr:hypothetical protein BGLA2_1470012 [Burkholderia gladioli]
MREDVYVWTDSYEYEGKCNSCDEPLFFQERWFGYIHVCGVDSEDCPEVLNFRA